MTLRALLDDTIDRLTLCDREDLVQVRAMLARLEAAREATARALERTAAPTTLGTTFALEDLEGADLDPHDSDAPTGWHSGRYDFEGGGG